MAAFMTAATILQSDEILKKIHQVKDYLPVLEKKWLANLCTVLKSFHRLNNLRKNKTITLTPTSHAHMW